jgi:hypothetical protein
MAEFCKLCGSLIVDDSCSYKKCKNHKLMLSIPATYKQIEFLKELDCDNIDFEKLTKNEASELINEAILRKETGGE